MIGHQWWWEFRYPQYGVVTANELYLPAGRTVNFQLNSRDVIHSFWAPQLGGKRDVIANRTNYLWYTPDSSLAGSVFNGFCAEYCGSSHANMRFHVYTVAPADFESWAAHQKEVALMSPSPGRRRADRRREGGGRRFEGRRRPGAEDRGGAARRDRAGRGLCVPAREDPGARAPADAAPGGRSRGEVRRLAARAG